METNLLNTKGKLQQTSNPNLFLDQAGQLFYLKDVNGIAVLEQLSTAEEYCGYQIYTGPTQ